MKRILLTAAALGVMIVTTTIASAIPPEKDAGSAAADYLLWDCSETFSICEMGDFSWRSKLFFFNNGDPKKYIEHDRFLGGMYECGNPDNFLAYNPLRYTYTYYFVSDEEVFHGVFAMITVPGYGQIFRDVGNVRFDVSTGQVIFEAGEHEWWNEEFDAVCNYLMNGN